MTRPLKGRLRVLLACYALSNLGTGLVFPFTAIYLVKARDISPGAAGLFFGLIAATTFACTPASGRLADTWSPRAMCAIGALCQAAGYSLMASASSISRIVGYAILIGVGNSILYPAFTPVMTALLDPDQRKRGFSYRYLAMNLGLGAGAVLAGHFLGEHGTVRDYQSLYLLDGASFLPFAVAVFAVSPAAHRTAAGSSRGDGNDYRALLRIRPLLMLLMIQTLLVLFGYSQLDSAVPVLLTTRAGVPASAVGIMIAANTAAVVVLQVPLGRLLERGRGGHVLALGAAIWAGAALLGASAIIAPVGWRLGLLLAYAVAFAAGETCYAVSYQPLLTEFTPARLLGRGSALSGLAWNVGAMAGPSIGLLAVGAIAPVAYWGSYGAAMAGTAVLAAALKPQVVTAGSTKPAASGAMASPPNEGE